jgi:transcriptional regulator with XRE-family HTH domain
MLKIMFSTNLRRYLDRNGLSLKEFSAKLGVPASTIHGWVNDVPPRNIIMLKKIADLMKCSIDQLCFEESFNSDHIQPDLYIVFGNSKYKVVLEKAE